MPTDLPLFEAVPNFSDGRNQKVMDAVASASTAGGPHLLDRHADGDHNRLVLSLASTSAEALAEGLLAAIGIALEKIDLRKHAGVHPRVGVADVVPIVPLDGTPMAGCIEAARLLGERVWTELSLPVYFYGAAAVRPEARRLASIRAGGLEPDLGGPALHPSGGAVCIGARPLLVAYNVLLPGATLDEATALARALRESSGGLPGVQGLAFQLTSGAVQLSMNLVDMAQSPPALVIEAISRLAADQGLKVGDEEVVGLCPAAAATPAAGGRLLEGRLAAAGARAGAAACRKRGGREMELVAGRLEAEAQELGQLAAGPEKVLEGAERSMAAARVMRATSVREPEAERMLHAAARGFRAGLPETGFPGARVAALDRWLVE